MRVLLEVKVNVAIVAPENARAGSEGNLFLHIFPSNDLSYPIFKELVDIGAQFALKGAVIVETVIYLDDCEHSDLVIFLEEIKNLQRLRVFFEIGLKDKVELVSIITGTLAESCGML